MFGPVVFVVLWGMALCAISSSASKKWELVSVLKLHFAFTGYRRLYLCDRFFEQKMADFGGCTTPEETFAR